MTSASTTLITTEHQALLAASAISLDVAKAGGVFSALTTADLPDDLAYLSEALLPALVFTHRSPSDVTVHQARPDNPQDGGKYLQPAGSGSLLSVHPTQANKIGLAKRLLIVEGTKQALAAVTWAPTDTLVVGIQGAQGWIRDGSPNPDLEKLLGDGTDVKVAFDADVNVNRAVYDSAAKLGAHMNVLGANSISYIGLPTGGKSGLDDYLAVISEGRREAVLETLMTKATKLGRAPAAPKAKPASAVGIAPVVDWDNAQIIVPIVEGMPPIRLAAFAARITHTLTVEDDLNDRENKFKTNLHDLEIKLRPDDEPHTVYRIDNSELEKTSLWLGRMPGSIGTRVDRRSGTNASEDIAGAIRRHASENEVRQTRGFNRTGPATVNGVFGYLSASGLLTGDGLSDAAVAVVSPPFNRISFPDPAKMSKKTREEAIAVFPELLSLVGDQSALVLTFGHLTQGASGSRINGVVQIEGDAGGGKTTQVRAVASCLGPWFGSNSMLGAAPTPGAIRSAGEHIHHMLIVTDDVARAKNNEASNDTTADAMDEFVRRAHGGGGEGRPRQTPSLTRPGTFDTVATELSDTIGVVVGEIMNVNAGSNSGAERVISTKVFRATSFKSDAALKTFEDISMSARPNEGFALVLQWMARNATEFGPEKWFASIDAEIDIQKTALSKYSALTPRSRRVAAGVMVGWRMLTTALNEIAPSIVDEAQREEMLKHGHALIVQAILRHTAVALGGTATVQEGVLDRIRSLMASAPDVWVITNGDTPPNEREKRLGKHYTIIGGGTSEQVVALIPNVIAQALQEKSGAIITQRLAAIAHPNKNGKTTRSVRFNGMPINAICIPLAIWQGDAAEIPQAQTTEPRVSQGSSPGNEGGSSPQTQPATHPLDEMPEVDA